MKYDYKKLTPFKMQCLTNFPFIDEDFDALTNYGLLCKIVEYVNNISTNNNLLIDNINDLNNWFNNLDVQEEINNKLDEMAESGELTDIIAQYLELAGVLSFNTINDMKNATNLSNGSTAKTLGSNSLLDGKGNFYKIRSITNTDVVDNIHIISLTNYNNLIAELIPDLTTNRYIFIGDSYVTGTLNGVKYATDGWAKRIKDYLGLSDYNCYIYGDGGSGFTANGHQGYNFVTLLSNNLDNIINKNTITHIVVCGGYNDQNSAVNTIKSAINNLMSIVDSNFPNAKVYIGCISTTSQSNATARGARRKINHTVLPAYKQCTQYNAYYLNGVESILKDYSLMGTDYFHPSIDGYNELAYGIIEALQTGYYSKITDINNFTITSDALSGQSITAYEKITNDSLNVYMNGYVTYTNAVNLTDGSDILIGTVNSKYIRKNFSTDFYFTTQVLSVDSSKLPIMGYLYLDDENKLYLHIFKNNSGISSTTQITFLLNNFFNIND